MKEILIALIPYVVPVLLAGLTWLGKKASDWMGASVKNKTLAGILTRLDYSVIHAVQYVAQTYTDALKEAGADGTVTEDEMRSAKQKAIDAAKSFLGQKGMTELVTVLGIDPTMVDHWLGMRIESAVRSLKAADAAAPVGGASAAPLSAVQVPVVVLSAPPPPPSPAPVKIP